MSGDCTQKIGKALAGILPPEYKWEVIKIFIFILYWLYMKLKFVKIWTSKKIEVICLSIHCIWDKYIALQ